MCGLYSRTELADPTLVRHARERVARGRGNDAELLADLAEIDGRRLYLPAGYQFMRPYCIDVLGMSEDVASKYIHAARAARKFPEIFYAVADGRLHLTAVCLLASHLTAENAEELLAAAAHQTKAWIQRMLVKRSPRTEALPLVSTIPVMSTSPGQQPRAGISEESLALTAGAHAPAHVEGLAPTPQVEPISAESYLWHLSVRRSAQEKLQYAQELLSREIPSGDAALVLERGLEELIRTLEKRKFAATSSPRSSRRRSSTSARQIPAAVKRAVWERDGGQCTFTSDNGHRCQARRFLEFDHATPVARGGEPTAENVRLRCRSHNQYAAECAFGTEFMRRKRERAAEERAAAAQARARADAAAEEVSQDVLCALRNLGYRADQARHAAAQCDSNPEATFEHRIRIALACLRPTRATSYSRAVQNPGPAT